MKMCAVHDAGTIELYFYDELQPAARAGVDTHLRECRECAGALEELQVIRAALARQPAVAAPPSGDWSGFMERLDASILESGRMAAPVQAQTRPFRLKPKATGNAGITSAGEVRHDRARGLTGLLATAALLAIVAISVFFASQAGRRAVPADIRALPAERAAQADIDDALKPAHLTGVASGDQASFHAGFASVGARHFERSKLVVLGLATKEPADAEIADWAYERQLASALLNDTRLYRMAAEQRGLASLAGVMRDLELVLLQASMAEASDDTALPQIQRLIRKRGLVQKMDVVGTSGLVP